MAATTIRGHSIDVSPARDSHSRRATQYTNKILAAFKTIGISENAVKISEERVPMRKAAASVSWYADGQHCHYSYSRRSNYTENLGVVLKLIELETQAVTEGKKTAEEFAKEFTEDEDVTEQRKEARKTLCVDENCNDFALIDAQYKKLAKAAHPDMPNGSTEAFKKINNAHKLLKRELD